MSDSQGVVTKIKRTCYACPSQWEGKLSDGRMFYIRYRGGRFEVRTSDGPTDNLQDAVIGKTIFLNPVLGGPFDGYMSNEIMLKIIQDFFNLDDISGIVDED